MTEEDTYKALYLRYGGLDTNVEPKMSLRQIAFLMDKNIPTIHTALSKYITRGNKYFNLKFLTNGDTNATNSRRKEN